MTKEKRSTLLRREKPVLIRDLVTIINNRNLSYGTKYSAMNDALWHWTEMDGKFEGGTRSGKPGCSLWSGRALAYVITPGLKRKEIQKSLRHEHVVPRVLLIDHVIGFPPSTNRANQWNEDALGRFLEKFCRAVIVHVEEDKKLSKKTMPGKEQWINGSPWARYKEADIEVFEASVIWREQKIEVPARSAIHF